MSCAGVVSVEFRWKWSAVTVTDPGTGPATCSFSVTDPTSGIASVVFGPGFAGMVRLSIPRPAMLEDSLKVPSALAVQVELIAPDETGTGDTDSAVRPATDAVVVLPLTLAQTELAVTRGLTPTDATQAGDGLAAVASGVGPTVTAPVDSMPIPSGLLVLGAAIAAGTAKSSMAPLSALTAIPRL